MGRPTKYSQEIADKICDRISSSSDSMVVICNEVDVDYSNVKKWLQIHEDFRTQYARAKQDQADYLVEEILTISDQTCFDTHKVGENEVANNEWIARSRLRVDSRKWLASKLFPKKYGEKLDVTTDGEKITNIDLSKLSNDTLAAIERDNDISGKG